MEGLEIYDRVGGGDSLALGFFYGLMTGPDVERALAYGVGHGALAMTTPGDTSGLREGARPGWEGGLYAFMRRVLASDHGRSLYSKREQSIEPVFGQIKGNRRIDRFTRGCRAAVRSERRLISASHNLLKLHSHWIEPALG